MRARAADIVTTPAINLVWTLKRLCPVCRNSPEYSFTVMDGGGDEFASLETAGFQQAKYEQRKGRPMIFVFAIVSITYNEQGLKVFLSRVT
jgi:hypothetical protein